jgi:hypothetical protein
VDFGVRADGVSDDGPAIQRLLAAAAVTEGPVRVVFPPDATVRVRTAADRYALVIRGVTDLTVDGRGSTFVLSPHVRFLHLTESCRVRIQDLNIDFDPLPFVDGTVTAVDLDRRAVEVRPLLREHHPLPSGGPTHEDGEQAFFSMLWYPGPYGTVSRHYWTSLIEADPTAGTLQVHAAEPFDAFGDIEPGTWQISIPVPGIAHRYGPGACLVISDNRDVALENVELWSAPWFGYEVFRNEGEITFRRSHIRPKPGSGRLMSTWRDGFHVKGNRGRLLWEDCILEGMNDDALNLSTHCSRVQRLRSPTEVVVLQTFPLGIMPWYEGTTLAAADFATRALLGTARIVEVAPSGETREIDGRPAAAPVILTLDREVPGLAAGTMVWSPDTANPDTTLRRCRIRNSCRLQCPVLLEACDVTALLWFYAEEIEGPFPSRVTVRDCVLRRGRGNPRLALAVSGCPPERLDLTRPGAPRAAIGEVRITDSEIHGDLEVIGVEHLLLKANRFPEPGSEVRVENCRNLKSGG